MSSRDAILERVRQQQPDAVPLPGLPDFMTWFDDPVQQFTETVGKIGGRVIPLDHIGQATAVIRSLYPDARRIVTGIPELYDAAEKVTGLELPHTFDNVDVAVIRGQWAVAENGAVWVTERDCRERVLPFISQALVLVLEQKQILTLLHEAYDRIGEDSCGYGVFIAGPSKTADIEQSLVLGAHGPKSMAVLLLP